MKDQKKKSIIEKQQQEKLKGKLVSDNAPIVGFVVELEQVYSGSGECKFYVSNYKKAERGSSQLTTAEVGKFIVNRNEQYCVKDFFKEVNKIVKGRDYKIRQQVANIFLIILGEDLEETPD